MHSGNRDIVIVTKQMDPHADVIISKLNHMKRSVIRLNTDDIPQNVDMSFAVETTSLLNGVIHIRNSNRHILLDKISSIWWRRPGKINVPTTLSEQEQSFAQRELQHVIEGIFASVNCYWISFFMNIRSADWKPEQLNRAQKVGFTIPRTLITTKQEEVKAFFEQCNGNIIYKVMSDPGLAMTKVKEPITVRGLLTTPISESDITHFNETQLVPCEFQERISKKFELRVTIIGDEIFAAEIHSQDQEQTRTDWRADPVSVTYRKANLPMDIADRCLALTKSYGLNYSAIDLILTPDGRYVFLEINPNGQFMWIEQFLPELRMTDALVTCLARGSNN